MSKELEEIKSIVAIHFGALGFLNPSENEQILKDRDKVLNALTELQSIKESNPSEAMKCLERIREFLLNRTRTVSFQDLRDIEQVLLKAEKEHKTLEIIKEKGLCWQELSMIKRCDYAEYKRSFQLLTLIDSVEKTEEEFILLKGTLK